MSGGRGFVALVIYISAPVLGVLTLYRAFRTTGCDEDART